MKLRRFVMARRRAVVAVVAAALVATAARAGGCGDIGTGTGSPAASSVRDWNLHALNALVKPPDAPEPGAGQPPRSRLLHMAMVHGAIYDAVNAIDGGYQPFLPDLQPASPSASVDAAVATAAHDVLVGLVTDPPLPEAVVTRLDGLYEEALAAIPDGADKTDGIAAGAAAAAAMLAARADDGRYVPFSHPVGDQPGEWRPAPPDEVRTRTPGWPTSSRSRSTARRSSARRGRTRSTAPSTPPSTTRSRTSAPSTVPVTRSNRRSPTSTTSPTELFNRTLRTVAEAEGLTPVEEARLFAMANVATADTIINCWNDKAYWHFWRPITAIHEGDNDTNDDTVGDPAWEPMLPTPPYPDHTSGFNCVASAMMHSADAFFGGEPVAFSVVRIAPDEPEVTREYATFTDVIPDVIDARVFQGIHFRAADEQSAEMGANVAEWVATNHFQPASAASMASAPPTT